MIPIVLAAIDWEAVGAVATIVAAVAGACIARFLSRGERRAKNLDAFDNYRRELLDLRR